MISLQVFGEFMLPELTLKCISSKIETLGSRRRDELHPPPRSCAVLCLVAQSCLIRCDPMDYSPPSSSVRGILQARILECVAISSSKGSSQPRDQTQVSSIAGGLFTIWVIREVRPQEVMEPLITGILQPLTKDYKLFSFNPIALI